MATFDAVLIPATAESTRAVFYVHKHSGLATYDSESGRDSFMCTTNMLVTTDLTEAMRFEDPDVVAAIDEPGYVAYCGLGMYKTTCKARVTLRYVYD